MPPVGTIGPKLIPVAPFKNSGQQKPSKPPVIAIPCFLIVNKDKNKSTGM